MKVSLVIPARNAAPFLPHSLGAVAPLVDSGELEEIILVDDGSTDATASLAADFPVRVISTGGRGRGGARNVGWRAAKTPLIWFIDADCVAEEGALRYLKEYLSDPAVGAAGGSYGNMRPESILACLIQEEIAARHATMPSQVDFLATFDVLYRGETLEAVGGFNERYLRGQDAELAYRVADRGGELRFDARSKVKHFHANSITAYLRAQRHQGFWRMWLYFDYPKRASGDSYSGFSDHIQPPLAMVSIAGLFALLVPESLVPGFRWLALAAPLALVAAQIPLTLRLVRRTGKGRFLLFAGLSFVRAFWRGVGMTQGCLAVFWSTVRGRRPPTGGAVSVESSS